MLTQGHPVNNRGGRGRGLLLADKGAWIDMYVHAVYVI